MSTYQQHEPLPSQGVTWVALLLALAGTAGSIWLSLGMQLEACALCYYQRSFMMALVGVLFLGLTTGANNKVSLSLLALPLAVAGLGVAGFHVYLEKTGQLECPLGLFDQGTAPQQSAVVFLMLTVMLLADVFNRPGLSRGSKLNSSLVGLILGGAFAFGCIRSAVPLKAPTQAYPQGEKIKTCRVPYKDKGK